VIAAQEVAPFADKQSIVGPNAVATRPFRFLDGGDGTGVAFADFLISGTDPTNRLRLQAQRAGNQGNLISVKLLASQGADAVTVTGNDIVVTRIAATTTMANLAAAINGNANANALVQATAVGAGSLGSVEKTHLACGAGEQAVAQVGGAPATITLHTDTSMVVTAAPAALVAAGVAIGDVVHTNVLLDYQRLQSEQLAVA